MRLPHALVVGAALLATAAADVPRPPLKSSPIAVNADGSRVAVVNPDTRSVSLIDAVTLTRVAEIPVRSTPETAAFAGAQLLVATREGIDSIDLASGRVTASARIGGGSFGVIADGSRIFVTCPAASRVAVLDGVTLQESASIATDSYPRGLALDRDRSRLYVTHFRNGRVSVIDTATLAVVKGITTDADANLSQAVVLDPARNRAYVPQTRSFSANEALLFDTTVFPTISAIDLETLLHVSRDRISIDVADRPVNMPLDAVLTSGRKLYVVNAGSDDVSVIDLDTRRAVAHLAVGSNPRGIALSPDERTAYVNNALSGSVTVIDTSTDSVRTTVPSTTIPLAADILNGKILFHTSNRTTLSKDRWISCATCHFDGGADGRTWFFRDGPRNSTALFGVAQTMPMHWSGDLDELQDVESTIRIVQAGTGLAEGASHCEPACDGAPPNAGRTKDLDDLAAFMVSLTAPAHPGEIDNTAAARGNALFHDPRVGCAECHPAPLFTDRKKHDVGTGTNAKERKGRTFDTPSLRGLYDTAPYLHDGSAATLLDVVRAAKGQHGNATGLTEGELKDLAEFLRSIPFPAPKRRSAAR